MVTIVREGSRTRFSKEPVPVIMTWPGRVSRTAVRQSEGIGVVGWLFSLSLAAYFIAKPFYLFESGNPQVADFLLAGLFVFLLFSRPRIKLGGMSLLMPSIYFSIYLLITVTISSRHFIINKMSSRLISGIFDICVC